MKKIFIICIFTTFYVLHTEAQVAINTTASSPNTSSMLDISSTTKGLLIPRMTTVQRAAIVSPANGLIVYDITTEGPWYYKAGTGWIQIASNPATLTLPYNGSANSASTLFTITNTGTGGGISSTAATGNGIYSSTGSLSSAALLGDNLANGEAVTGRTNSKSGIPTGAVVGRNDGAGYGVKGFIATDTSGNGIGVLGTVGVTASKGVGGHFENLNASNPRAALEAVTNGTGSAFTATNTNNANTANILNVTTNGPGVIANHSQGNAGNFFMNNTSGVGAGVRGEVNSIFGNNGTAGVYGVASGTGGYGGYFEHSNSTGFGYALFATTVGQGTCAYLNTPNTSNTQPTLQVYTAGTGNAATFVNTNNSNVSNIVNVTTNGPGVIADHSQGNAGNFFMNNTSGVGAGVRGEVNSIFGNNGTAGVYGIASGTGGYGGYFEHSNSTGFGYALYATTAGQGTCAYLTTPNTSNTQPTLQVNTSGTGNAATFVNTNNSNVSNILNVTTNGPGVIADHSQGNAGNFFVNNTSAVAAGVRGEVNSIFGNAGTAGVYGVASGTGGYAGFFDHTETTGYGISVYVTTHDLGTAMVVDHEGSGGDLAIFQTGGFNEARIDRTGKGYFNNGTQNGGADLAESFSVEGNTNEYTPGDVMIISTLSDRTLEKSDTAYSSLVAGVYATKPGVLLTESNIDVSLDKNVPLGVIGVIPTKVCNEGGSIKRGDILVTSGKQGYAMKADLNKLKPGQAIGKALENFDDETGKIKVLVNVK